MVKPNLFFEFAFQKNFLNNVFFWVWFFLLVMMALVWTTEYNLGYRRSPRQPIIPPLNYFTRSIENFNNCAPYWDQGASEYNQPIREDEVERMFDYSNRFMDAIFSQGIFTPPQNELNLCR